MYMVFFFNDTATTEIYTLSLHDALPIFAQARAKRVDFAAQEAPLCHPGHQVAQLVEEEGLGEVVERADLERLRSEEHTSELQSPCNLVCRLLLEKKNTLPDEHTHQPHSV